ncbi:MULTISPECIES: nucleotidyltransferase family protein [unclassified Anabaena]|uniref:nucleotidyltransferase domain-containing protein n=1 Tax=unclassified Anabaena TaxID=2619674 RepID=UPI0039C6A78E
MKTQPHSENQEIKNRLEIELLLNSVRTHPDPSTTEQIKTLLEQDLDWTYIIQTATFHKVMPLLYQNLNTICPELVPQDILAELLYYFKANARRNLFLTNELLKLLNLFESHNLTVIPIKGPILAVSVYNNLALRQFGDIDILVRPQDAIIARDLLVTQGFQNTYNHTREQEVARLKSPYCKDNNYTHKHTGVNLDLHWQLLQKYLSFPIAHERLWQRHALVTVAGKTVINLSPEDNLLFLCVHACRDRWNKLSLISDIAALICVTPEINWDLLIKQAQELGCWKRFLLGIILAKNLLETDLPTEILSKIEAEPGLVAMTTQVRERLFIQTYKSPALWTRYLFDLNIRERLQDKVKYGIYQSILVTARSNKLFPSWI